jgi:mono/diheme cytochrome c family protein
MKKLSVISFVVSAVLVISCSDVRRSRGREYMPDMAYSRAYETYAPHENLAQRGINYNAMPVSGTIKRGEIFPFPIPKDKDGDSVNYIASRQVQNPIADAIDSARLKEAERLYLINCGICHGTGLDGNGPLYNNGNGPYPAAPKNLVGDPVVSVMPEGQLFYSVTYGRGQMGPYGSQLTTSQRWQVVHYVKTRQLAAKSGGGAAAGATTGGATGGGGGTTSGGAGSIPGGAPGSVPNPTSGGTNGGKSGGAGSGTNGGTSGGAAGAHPSK